MSHESSLSGWLANMAQQLFPAFKGGSPVVSASRWHRGTCGCGGTAVAARRLNRPRRRHCSYPNSIPMTPGKPPMAARSSQPPQDIPVTCLTGAHVEVWLVFMQRRAASVTDRRASYAAASVQLRYRGPGREPISWV